MARNPTARWSATSKAWRSDVGEVGSSGRRKPVYIRGIPFGPPGSAAWQQAQAALEDYLRSDARPPRLVRPARRPKPAPIPGPGSDFDDEAIELEAVADDPSPAEIAAAMIPMRAKRQRGMGDGRAEVDQPGRTARPPRSLPPADPPTLAAIVAALVREWKRRTHRNRDLAALPRPDVVTC